MALTTVNNATFDAALAAVAAAYDGAWTRTGTTTDLDSTPMVSPNSDIKYHVLTANGYDVYISYDQLSNAAVLRSIALDALGVRFLMTQLQAWVTELNAVINGSNFDPLDPDKMGEHYWQIILKSFQALPMLGIMFPFSAYKEVANSDMKNTALVASFTLVDNSDVAEVTNTSTGLYHFGLIDWEDGHIELIDTVAVQPLITHDYADAAADTYTIRMWLIGPNGIDSATDTITVT